LQKIGAFKIRGALNTLLSLKEQNALPKDVVEKATLKIYQVFNYYSKKGNTKIHL
jgi:hypothetical protein